MEVGYMRFKIVLEQGLDGYITAYCPSLRGCVSQGKTEGEAIANIKEAILLYLEPAPEEIQEAGNHRVLELAI